MKIYVPNTSKQSIGGGWTFLRNLEKGLGKYGVQFVDRWEDCDVILIVGVTITDPYEIEKAVLAGKKAALRVDNMPRKSRNRNNTPHERMKQLADMCELTIYQSEWSREYCKHVAGDGTVIHNGVDEEIFYPAKQKPENDTYLFAYHGKSELKQFWLAHYYYQMVHRENPKSEFWFIYDFGRDLPELQRSNFDFWNNETYMHVPKQHSAEDMAKIMRQCTHLTCPYTVEAAPNTVLEARACGLEVVGYVRGLDTGDGMEYLSTGGVKEYVDLADISLERMAEEYYGVLSLLGQNV